MVQRSRDILKKILIRLVFSLGVFIYLVGTESYQPILTDYCYHGSQTEIELVVSVNQEIDFSFLKWFDASPKQTTALTQPGLDFSSIHKMALFQYNNTVLHQIKSLDRAFTPNHRLLSILHKKAVWHQSSDEDPALLG